MRRRTSLQTVLVLCTLASGIGSFKHLFECVANWPRPFATVGGPAPDTSDRREPVLRAKIA
jgi:hypothetical protein